MNYIKQEREKGEGDNVMLVEKHIGDYGQEIDYRGESIIDLKEENKRLKREKRELKKECKDLKSWCEELDSVFRSWER